MTIKQLRVAKANGISLPTLESRLRYGWSDEEAVSIPVARRRPEVQWGSIARTARANGLTPNRVYQRLHSGWPLERAMTTPARAYRRAR